MVKFYILAFPCSLADGKEPLVLFGRQGIWLVCFAGSAKGIVNRILFGVSLIVAVVIFSLVFSVCPIIATVIFGPVFSVPFVIAMLIGQQVFSMFPIVTGILGHHAFPMFLAIGRPLFSVRLIIVASITSIAQPLGVMGFLLAAINAYEISHPSLFPTLHGSGQVNLL